MDALHEIVGAVVSRETESRLTAYRALLEKWNSRINLVARSTIEAAQHRHFLDSAQLAQYRDDAKSWVDLGAGGGFPGLVLAILFNDIEPELHMTLVESDRRKTAFLHEVARQTETDVEIISDRVESISGRKFDIVSARALAPLSKLLAMSYDLLSSQGRCVFLKGARHESELDEARKEWQFELKSKPSATQSDSTVLVIEGLRRV